MRAIRAEEISTENITEIITGLEKLSTRSVEYGNLTNEIRAWLLSDEGCCDEVFQTTDKARKDGYELYLCDGEEDGDKYYYKLEDEEWDDGEIITEVRIALVFNS